MTYEMFQKDADFLGKFNWRVMFVDEAHRLKNAKSKLYEAVETLRQSGLKVLLTGMSSRAGRN